MDEILRVFVAVSSIALGLLISNTVILLAIAKAVINKNVGEPKI